MIVLYYFYPACSLVAHIAFEESGLVYEARPVDLKDPAQFAEYKKINPRGTIPAMTVDGQPLTENIAILTYIADLVPEAGIIPTGLMERAQCMSLLSWSVSTAHINFRRSFRPERFSADPAAFDGIIASARPLYWANLQWIDERLQKQEWMLGKTYSAAADGYALRLYDWGRIAKYPVEELKAFSAFKDRIIARPSVRRVLERERSPLVMPA